MTQAVNLYRELQCLCEILSKKTSSRLNSVSKNGFLLPADEIIRTGKVRRVDAESGDDTGGQFIQGASVFV